MSTTDAAGRWSAGEGSAARAVLAMIAVGTAARLAFAATVGMELDGSYSAAIAREFQAGYFDHPPLHYWLIKAAAGLFGREGAVLRLPFILLFAGSTWLLYRLTALVFGERAGFWAALSLTLSPPFTLAFGMFLVPDGPLVFFSLLAAWIVARLTLGGAARGGGRDLAPWLAAGAAGGLALLSKYSAVFLFAGLFAFLLTTPHRRVLLTPGPWLGVGVAALLFVPTLLWNLDHGWASLAYQGGRAAPGAGGGLRGLWDGIIGQFGYLLAIYPPLVYLLVRAVAGGPRQPRSWYFACLAALPVLAFTLLNLAQPGLPHWTMPGWLFAFPLLGDGIARLSDRWRRAVGGLAWVAAGAFAAGLAVVAVHANTGFLDPLLARVLPGEGLGRDPLLEFQDWTDAGQQLAGRGLLAGDTAFLAGLNWATAGRTDYALGRQYPVLCVCTDPHHFQYMRDSAAFAGATGLLIDRPDMFAQHRAFLDAHFDRIEPLPPVIIRRGGRPALELKVERGIGFRPDDAVGR